MNCFPRVEKPKARFVRATSPTGSSSCAGETGKTGGFAETGEAATTTVHCHMQFSELNERQLTMLLRNVGSGESDEVGKEIKFTSVWLNDQHMLTVHRLGVFPYNGTYDESKRLMFVGEEVVLNIFQGYSALIKTPFDNRDALVAPWIALVRALCEGDNPDKALRDRCFVFYRNVLAKKVQDPCSKIGFFPILEGKTKTGKNVHIVPVGKMLGEEQYFITSKLDDIVGKHATLWVGKLLVVINECETSKDQAGKDGILRSRITDLSRRRTQRTKRSFAWRTTSVPGLLERGGLRAYPSGRWGAAMVSLKAGEAFRHRAGTWWEGLVKHFERPDFIAALYDYLNTVDLAGYDFKKEREKVLTDSYRKLLDANVPFVARFVVYLLRRILKEACKAEYGDLIFFELPLPEGEPVPVRPAGRMR